MLFLEFLDISNFNLIKWNSFDNKFMNIYNIKYIDIRNFKNHKNISERVNLIKLIYACQKNIIQDKLIA